MHESIWNRFAATALVVCAANVVPCAALGEEPAFPSEVIEAPVSIADGNSRWSPPEPSESGFDWIQLKSGEWLKGEIQRMRDGSLYFDSDELDELDLDWDDVRSLRSPKRHSYVFEGRRVLTGPASMRGDQIIVSEDGTEHEFDRSKLVRIVAGDESRFSWWSGKLVLGILARAGNTKSRDLTSTFSISREAPVTRFGIDYTGAISTQDDEATANNHRAKLAFDIYVSRRLYLTIPSIAYYRDTFQNIQNQITPGLGVGYDVLDTKYLEWEVGVGAGYQYTEFASGLADSPSGRDAALLFSTDFEVDLTKNLDWDTNYQLQYVVTDPGLTTQHFMSTLSFDVWDPFDFDVSFNWDRVQDPVPDSDGEVPLSDDFRLSVGLGIEF